MPESVTLTLGSEAVELTVILPLAFAADCGVNRTLNVTLAPGASVRGRFSPPMLNAATVDRRLRDRHASTARIGERVC